MCVRVRVCARVMRCCAAACLSICLSLLPTSALLVVMGLLLQFAGTTPCEGERARGEKG